MTSNATNPKAIAAAVEILFRQHKTVTFREYQLPNGQRLDVAGISPGKMLFGCEIKVSVSDFNRDMKWMNYAQFCALFFFAVPIGFDIDRIPMGPGVISSDGNTAIFVRRNRWQRRLKSGGLSHAKPQWYGSAHGASIPRL